MPAVSGPSPEQDAHRDGEDDVRRRTLLQGIALGVGGQFNQDTLDAVDQTQEMLRRALSPVNSVSRETVEWWRDQVFGQAVAYRSVPARTQILSALAQFNGLCRLLNQRQSLTYQQSLTRSASRLAGLIGILLVDLGQPTTSRSWFETGRQAAREVENGALAAWLTSREALTCLYYEGPLPALALAQHAQRMSGTKRSVAAALVPAIAARALSQMGHDRESVELMKTSEERHSRLAPGGNAGALGFSEQKLLFYKGNVSARSGKPQEALGVCRAALRQCPEHDVVDRGHIRLDEAAALVRLGEAEASSSLIADVLADLPSAEGLGAVLAEAEELLHLMQARGAMSAARRVAEALRAKAVESAS